MSCIVIHSATFSYPMNFTDYLGDVKRNASGHIISARTSLTRMNMQIDKQRADSNLDNNAGLAEVVSN